MNKRKAGGKAAKAPMKAGLGTVGPARRSAAVDLETVRDLARIATEFDLAEIEADPSGRVRVSRRLQAAAIPAIALPEPRGTSPAALSLMPALVDSADAGLAITSPFVGTFYGSPSPDAATYVEVGQQVRKGQVVCIVEAMKLMNEIESEVDGKIVEVLAKSGGHVEYGQPLFRVAKS